MNENEIGNLVIEAAIRVHRSLGPGLLESAYEACLVHALKSVGLDVASQIEMPVHFEGVNINVGYRLDILVNQKVVIELKSVEMLRPVHTAQLLSYLKLGGYRLGYLLNFNVPVMREGIKRLVNKL